MLRFSNSCPHFEESCIVTYPENALTCMMCGLVLDFPYEIGYPTHEKVMTNNFQTKNMNHFSFTSSTCSEKKFKENKLEKLERIFKDEFAEIFQKLKFEISETTIDACFQFIRKQLTLIKANKPQPALVYCSFKNFLNHHFGLNISIEEFSVLTNMSIPKLKKFDGILTPIQNIGKTDYDHNFSSRFVNESNKHLCEMAELFQLNLGLLSTKIIINEALHHAERLRKLHSCKDSTLLFYCFCIYFQCQKNCKECHTMKENKFCKKSPCFQRKEAIVNTVLKKNISIERLLNFCKTMKLKTKSMMK